MSDLSYKLRRKSRVWADILGSYKLVDMKKNIFSPSGLGGRWGSGNPSLFLRISSS